MQSLSKTIDVKTIEKSLSELEKHKKFSSKSIEAIHMKRIVKITINNKYVPYWIFLGKSGDYIVIPRTSCTCKDFLIHVIAQKQKTYCYHLEAQILAEKEGKYIEITVNKDDLNTILLEILKNQYSPTLRRILLKTKKYN